MTGERRRHERMPGPFEGSWRAGADGGDCRIADLSPGGCFIDIPATVEPGRAITVTVAFGETRFTLPGEVVYAARVQGFGVRFVPSDQQRALAYVMGPTAPFER
jgi:hypothetical protein